MYFCLKCTPVEEVTKSKILDRIEIHVVLLLVACLKAEVSNTKEKVKQNEESGNEAVVVALLQMRGSFCPIPMHKLMNMNPTRLPMSSKAQLEPPPLVRWRVRLWVQDPLGACVTYQLKKKKIPQDWVFLSFYAIGRYPNSMTCLRRVIQAVIVTTTTRIFPCHLETAESNFAVAKTECCQVVPDAWN